MTPTQLRAFVTIARQGSTKAAAAELGVSEAAVSSHTASLRKELNDPLFTRRGGGIVFTPGGLRLATRAHELLGLEAATREEVAAAADGRRLLRLATTSLFAECAAPGLIERFRTRAADLDVELSVRPGSSLQGLIDQRLADVAIGPLAATTGPGVRSVEFMRYQLAVFGGPRNRLSAERASASQLAAEEWHLGPSVIEQGATQAILQGIGVPEARQRIYQSHAEALAAVKTGGGLTITTDFRAAPLVAEGQLVPISGSGCNTSGSWAASFRPDVEPDHAAAELVRFLSTPRAIHAMRSGAGAEFGRFRPALHVTLWS